MTKETDSTETHDFEKLVGYTVSPNSNYIVHFLKFQSNEKGRRIDTRIRFTGMDG